MRNLIHGFFKSERGAILKRFSWRSGEDRGRYIVEWRGPSTVRFRHCGYESTQIQRKASVNEELVIVGKRATRRMCLSLATDISYSDHVIC